MTWVVEVQGYDTSGPGATTLRFSMGAGVAFSDAAYAPSGFVSWKSASQRVDVSKGGGVTLSSDGGQLIIQNLPNDIAEAGPWDALADWAWQNRAASLYWVPAAIWANRVLTDIATLMQPDVVLQADGSLQSTLVFKLRDPRAGLAVPLQPTKYAGDNAGGMGVEGELDIKGKPKPVLYGVVSNISAIRVNASQLIYQVADASASILCVRDGGLGLAAGTARGTLASLQANSPVPGSYDTYAGVEGTFVKLGTTPVFQITIDAQEGTPSSNRTHAQIWSRLRQDRCATTGGDLVAASITACDVAAPDEVGFWWPDEITRLDAMNEILTSLSGYEVQGLDLKWSIAQLDAPSGTTSLDFLVVSPTTEKTSKSRAIKKLLRVRPGFAPDGAPPYRVNVQWGRNYTVMNEADFAGAAPQRLRDKFAQEFRTETASDSAVWDPVALTGPWIDAPELTVSTRYQPGADFLSCPQAATEAARLLALYDITKGFYQLDFTPVPGDNVIPGSIHSITYPQFLSLGPKFVALWGQLTVESEVANMSILLGFQA